MNAKEHQELLEKYISYGGNQRITEACRRFSLQNFAKLKYEFSRLNKPAEAKVSAEIPADKPADQESGIPKTEAPRKVFNDFIADYPVELHKVFRRRWGLWMEACSLKIQLGELDPKDEDEAFELQWKIWNCFKEFDQCQKVLKHYREHKRIMPLETETDFEGMSELEIYKHRDNLRALITRRKQTIKKMENSLPAPEDPEYKSRLHTLNLKREQLQEKENELMECEKFLNNGK
jgi:hypothetical protein